MLLNQRIKKWLKDTTQTLDISDLGLTEWPKQLVGKEHLIKTLNCHNNKLTSLPKDITKLKTLYCGDNKLTSFPNNLTNLKTLCCFNNKLTSLPNDLTKIEILSCWNNKLKSLPNDLTKLKILYCYENKLTSLPNSLTNLETLFCWNNQLTSLSNGLNKLKTLFCHHNKLFSSELTKWKKIWTISIRHQRVLRTAGIKRVVKVLKNRLYLPSLNDLREELIWSPNHPGKFFTSLPRVGDW